MGTTGLLPADGGDGMTGSADRPWLNAEYFYDAVRELAEEARSVDHHPEDKWYAEQLEKILQKFAKGRLHSNPQMQTYQLLAAGETVDLVYFGDGDASLLEGGSVTFEHGWVRGRDSGGAELSYPAHRVEHVHHNLEIPEIDEPSKASTGGEPHD